MSCTTCFLTILGFIFTVLASLKLYIKLTTGWCSSQRCLVGKTAIVTGANTGIGYETALDFAKRGARVILACRDQRRAEQARAKIIKETGNDNVIVRLIDMSSFDSVRAFAKEIRASEDRLDILVNNAGVYGIGKKKSKDGNDLLFQVNHLSAFLLTNLLINILKKSGPSRVINVSSLLANWANGFDVSRLNTYISDRDAYATSKLCNILFTIELARRLKETEITTYSLHPGVIRTEIRRYAVGVATIIEDLISKLFYKNGEEGAQTTIFCAVEKGIEKHSGEHFADCQRVSHYKTVTTNSKLAQDLWRLSEQLVELKQEELQF